ncbi:MAG: DUF2231 domain-containing protein [Thermoanaerobaculum sp.]|nr:DUF2231 domain-containing protein [Thermoanaerobaculum sp.]
MGWLPDPVHPAVVHFAVALPVVAVLFDLLALHPRCRSLAPAAPLLWLLVGLAGVAAYLSGQAAHEEAVIPQAARSLMEQHEEWGERLMVGLLVLAALRLAFWRLERFAFWLRGVLLAAGVLAAGAVAYTASLGGKLVYDHGVGTRLSLQGGSPAPADPSHDHAPTEQR